jgi:MFS family permease
VLPLPSVLRSEPQFRLLFAGQVLSILGDRIMLVALPFAVLEAGGSVSDVGFVVGAQLAPFLLFALVGGAISDRADRRWVLVASDVVRLVVQAVAAALLLAHAASPLALGALAAAYGAADAFFQPAFTGLLPQTVSHPGQLQPANALRGLSFSVAAIAGPALAGVLIGPLGAGAAFAFDAVSFAVSVAFLLALRPRAVAAAVEDQPPPLLAAVSEGWRVIRRRSWLLAGLGAMCAYHAIVLPAVFVLGPVFVARRFGDPAAWAAMVSSFGVGSAIASVLLLRWRPSRPMLAAGIALIVASTQAGIYGSGLPLAAMVVLQGIAGVGVGVFFTLWEASLQEHVPASALSRVSSFDYLASTALMPASSALVGPLAAAAGQRPTLFGMTALGVASAVGLVAVPGVRALRRGAEVPARSA